MVSTDNLLKILNEIKPVCYAAPSDERFKTRHWYKPEKKNWSQKIEEKKHYSVNKNFSVRGKIMGCLGYCKQLRIDYGLKKSV